jgi:hypothetical protein
MGCMDSLFVLYAKHQGEGGDPTPGKRQDGRSRRLWRIRATASSVFRISGFFGLRLPSDVPLSWIAVARLSIPESSYRHAVTVYVSRY